MRRVSSPGAYSLCSANSTEVPRRRAVWMPLIAPSDASLATSDSCSMRRATSGSRTLAVDMRGLDGDRAHQVRHELLGADALGLGAEVEDEAVLQDRPR